MFIGSAAGTKQIHETYNFGNHVVLAGKNLHLEESESGIDRVGLVDNSLEVGVLVQNDLADQVLPGQVLVLQVHVCDVSNCCE